MYPLRQLLADVDSSWIMKSFEVSEIFFQRSVALFKIEKEPNRTSRTFYLFRPSAGILISNSRSRIQDPRSYRCAVQEAVTSCRSNLHLPSPICYCMTARASTSAHVNNQSTTLLRSFLYFTAFRVP